MTAGIVAAIICITAAGLEGVAAGPGVRKRLKELRQPRFSPPLAVWIVIGLGYYLICWLLLVRVLERGLTDLWGAVTCGLLIAILIANGSWNFFFFRRRDLRTSYRYFVPYALLVMALMLVLGATDRVGAVILVPYVLYLGYGTWWFRRLCHMESGGGAPPQR